MTPAAWLAACLAAAPALAQTEVFIKLAGQTGRAEGVPLALPPFVAWEAAKPDDALLATQLRDIVRSDLLTSRYVKVFEDGPRFDGANVKDLLGDWKTRGAGWILAVKVSAPASQTTLAAQLVNAASGETSFERYYRQDRAFLRSLAHRLSDDVVSSLTGKPGIAHTQIAFANDQTGHKEIYLVDYDGANLRQLTRDGSISLLPRLSPGRKLLAYTSYKEGNPDLFLIDLERGKVRPLSAEQGLNIAGGFSPDGSQILLTLSRGGSPNVYAKSLEGGSLTRLTRHFGADSSPTFSPDGAQAAFVSDRSGNPQIYLLDIATQRPKRLTGMNWCDSPAWSPTGEWIAFAGRANVKDKMDIFLVDVTGGQVRQITRGEGSNENPAWSPDGRFIAFTSSRGGRPELFVMDSDGSAPHRLLDVPGRSFTPAWSD